MRTTTGLAIGLALLAGSGCFDFGSLHVVDGGGPGDGFVLAMMRHDGSSGDAGDVADMAAAPDAVADVPDLATPPDLAILPDLVELPDLAPPPDLVPPCAGWRGGPNNACWYIGSQSADCNTVCIAHGGFDIAGATHKGDDVAAHLAPSTGPFGVDPNSNNFGPVEYVAYKGEQNIDYDRHAPANGNPPTGTEHSSGIHVACACLN